MRRSICVIGLHLVFFINGCSPIWSLSILTVQQLDRASAAMIVICRCFYCVHGARRYELIPLQIFAPHGHTKKTGNGVVAAINLLKSGTKYKGLETVGGPAHLSSFPLWYMGGGLASFLILPSAVPITTLPRMPQRKGRRLREGSYQRTCI